MSQTIGENELRAILDGLEGVTPGPWSQAYGAIKSTAHDGEHKIASSDLMWGLNRDQKNAAHIARLDPDTVRSIVTLALEALDRRKDGLGTVSVKPLLEVLDRAQLSVENSRNGTCNPTSQQALEYRISELIDAVRSCLTSIGVEAGE